MKLAVWDGTPVLLENNCSIKVTKQFNNTAEELLITALNPEWH